MKKVVILGVSGGFGWWMAQVFALRGWDVSGVCRHPDRVRELPQSVRISKGDVADRSSWSGLLDKGDLLVYAVNPPYHQWRKYSQQYLECALQVAEQKLLTVLFPGNVYGFDPGEKSLFSEQDTQHAPTGKGRIRVQMEERLQQSCQRGARAIVLRMGDFIDPFAGKNNWFKLLLKSKTTSMIFESPSDPKVEHSWAYLPDAAEIFELLARRADLLPAYDCYHYRGQVFSSEQLVRRLSSVSGKSVALKRMSWFPLKAIALFSPLMREVLAMRYLWNKPLELDDSKLQNMLAAEEVSSSTALSEEAIRAITAKL